MASDPYKVVSMIYDHMMHRLSYNEWANYIIDIKTFYKDDAEKFLEVACGTGKLNTYLEKSFNDIVLLDISKSMLDVIPSDRKRVCADMTRQPFKSNFDFIYSTFDSINYITDEEEIVRYMWGIRNILSDDGIFTFDASLENNSIKNVKRLNRINKFKGIEYKQVSKYEKDFRLHRNSFRMKLANGEIIEEVHTQKIYDFEFYFDAGERAGLHVLGCFEAFTFEDANDESERIQFIMKKL
ncbi:MAG: class I SAM-dependent methyltransferase [Chlorobi bacterium]|nr:class I SAM-dependent methyltransferase [Chlorobiota bacterium]